MSVSGLDSPNHVDFPVQKDNSLLMLVVVVAAVCIAVVTLSVLGANRGSGPRPVTLSSVQEADLKHDLGLYYASQSALFDVVVGVNADPDVMLTIDLPFDPVTETSVVDPANAELLLDYVTQQMRLSWGPEHGALADITKMLSEVATQRGDVSKYAFSSEDLASFAENPVISMHRSGRPLGQVLFSNSRIEAEAVPGSDLIVAYVSSDHSGTYGSQVLQKTTGLNVVALYDPRSNQILDVVTLSPEQALKDDNGFVHFFANSKAFLNATNNS